ncbi:MAG TPA: hypothetical protein VMT37_01865 [Solirubrobacterales bacterium]|nr:hypothetical protein [Solirubrobacterales bacterium]
MRIVVSHEQLIGFGGTETYVFTVAESLQRLGHEVVVHTLLEGPAAEHARERGIRVESRSAQLPDECDAVLAQDAVTAYALAERYPEAVRVFVAHSVAYPLQSPPQAENACDAVVVMNDRVGRRTEGLARQLPVVRLRQPIDLQRFCFQTLKLEQRRREAEALDHPHGALDRAHPPLARPLIVAPRPIFTLLSALPSKQKPRKCESFKRGQTSNGYAMRATPCSGEIGSGLPATDIRQLLKRSEIPGKPGQPKIGTRLVPAAGSSTSPRGHEKGPVSGAFPIAGAGFEPATFGL